MRKKCKTLEIKLNVVNLLFLCAHRYLNIVKDYKNDKRAVQISAM